MRNHNDQDNRRKQQGDALAESTCTPARRILASSKQSKKTRSTVIHRRPPSQSGCDQQLTTLPVRSPGKRTCGSKSLPSGSFVCETYSSHIKPLTYIGSTNSVCQGFFCYARKHTI